MRINAGGNIDPQDVLGRDKTIERYWEVLRAQSLLMQAERRMGKTQIAKKMLAAPPADFVAIYLDLESVSAPIELFTALAGRLKKYLGFQRITHGFKAWVERHLPEKIMGVETATFSKKWKDAIDDLIGDALAHIPKEKKLLIILDEFPLMIYNFDKSLSTKAATELLDFFRSLRQKYGENLRFLFTGSIGLHLILRRLRASGYANDSMNDVQQEIVPPLSHESALELIRQLLIDNVSIAEGELNAACAALVSAISGYPFHLQKAALRLRAKNVAIDRKDATVVAIELIESGEDPAHLSNFLTRLHNYYGDYEVGCLAILDLIAGNDNCTLPYRTVETTLVPNPITRERFLQCIDVLQADHYLERVTAGGEAMLSFRWKMLGQWWKYHRCQ